MRVPCIWLPIDEDWDSTMTTMGRAGAAYTDIRSARERALNLLEDELAGMSVRVTPVLIRSTLDLALRYRGSLNLATEEGRAELASILVSRFVPAQHLVRGVEETSRGTRWVLPDASTALPERVAEILIAEDLDEPGL